MLAQLARKKRNDCSKVAERDDKTSVVVETFKDGENDYTLRFEVSSYRLVPRFISTSVVARENEERRRDSGGIETELNREIEGIIVGELKNRRYRSELKNRRYRRELENTRYHS